MSDEYLDEHGILYLNDKEYDDRIQNQWITKYLTINDMVELQKRGVDIVVLNIDDTKKIYDIICDHLNAWKDVLTTGLNTYKVPYDDLIELDKLASRIYPYAKNLELTNFVDSVLKRTAAEVSLFPTKELMASRPHNDGRTTINEELPTEEDKEYQSCADLFSNRKARAHTAAYTFSNQSFKK